MGTEGVPWFDPAACSLEAVAMTKEIPIPGTRYAVQYATGEPDPGCQVFVYFEGEERPCFEARLSEADRDTLALELYREQRGPICERLIAGADAAREAS